MDSLLRSKVRPIVKDRAQAGKCSTGAAGQPVGRQSQLGMTAMTASPFWPTQPTQDIFKIRGRMIPYEELPDRLKFFCASLGFEILALLRLPSNPMAVEPWSSEGRDTVHVSLTKVSYNPNWGGCCGLPRLLDHKKAQSSLCSSPAEFIAPFLYLYRFAQENIFLSQTAQGQLLITLPETLVRQGGEDTDSTLKFHLDRLVEPAGDGTLGPLMIAGTLHTFAVSPDFQQSFSALTRGWQQGRKLAIGHYLGRELFSFEVDNGAYSDSPYAETILPHLTEIVTHPTPNLRAAAIHMHQVFARDTARYSAECRKSTRNLLYIAGLDIDMTPFTGREEHYFVPWQAYISQRGQISAEGCILTQDDLYMKMMQQDKQCLV